MSYLPSSGHVPFKFQTKVTVELSEEDYITMSLLIEQRINGHLESERSIEETISQNADCLGIVEDCCANLRERFVRRDELRRVMGMFTVKK